MRAQDFLDTVTNEDLGYAVEHYYGDEDLEDIDEPRLAAAALAARWALTHLRAVVQDFTPDIQVDEEEE